MFGFGKKEDAPPATSTSSPAAPVTPAAGQTADVKLKKKICCSCPETKALRDVCIAERGEEHAYCQALIEAHKACLRVEGFNV